MWPWGTESQAASRELESTTVAHNMPAWAFGGTKAPTWQLFKKQHDQHLKDLQSLVL